MSMQDQLVRRAQAGDHEAFGALVHAVIGRLYSSARLILRDPDKAEDVVQDVLISAWRDVRALRDPGRWDAWLHRLLVRSCYRAAKQHRRREYVEIPFALDYDSAARDDLALVGLRDQLERAFDRLSTDQRMVLVLAYFADLSLLDISTALDIPIGTTKSRLHRAMAVLRAEIDSDARLATAVDGRTA